MSTSAKSSAKPASRSSDDTGISPAERRRLSKPFDPKVLAKARGIAAKYRMVVEFDEGLIVGSTVEMPLVMADGTTIEECATELMNATAAAVALMLEKGEAPPSPAREHKRDRQVNIRLSADEKFRLDEAARREGFRSLSDYMRAAALGRAS